MASSSEQFRLDHAAVDSSQELVEPIRLLDRLCRTAPVDSNAILGCDRLDIASDSMCVLEFDSPEPLRLSTVVRWRVRLVFS